MSEREAKIFDPKTGEQLANVALIGKLIRADELISESGSLQGFKILSGSEDLQDAWFNQKSVLMRRGNIQQLVKIATYPTEGEDQGYLDFVPGTREFCEVEEKSNIKTRARRGLAVIQALLGS